MPVPPRLPDFDPFAVLGVTPVDPPEVVKAAWRQRVKEHHPDAAGGSDEAIKRINVAYEWLRDPTLRQTLLLAARGLGGAGSGWTWSPTGSATPATARPDADWPGAAWPGAAWPSTDEDPGLDATYDGPRAARVAALVEHLEAASMARLLDLVHGYRPDLGWSVALARGTESSGRRVAAAAAVWAVRRAVRERIAVLLEDARTRETYDDELVGQVVSDRMADLVRGIVLLDLLSLEARERVDTEWSAVMGFESGGPGDEAVIGGSVGPVAIAQGRWTRLPDGMRWLLVVLAAATWATAMVALLPSREALAMILLGFGVVAVAVRSGRRSADR